MVPTQPFSILVIIIGTAFLVLLLTFFYLLFIQYSKRKIQHYKEVKELQTIYEQTLLKTQIEIQEQTFNYISEEIHDNIGQSLSLVRIKLNTLGDNVTEEKINDIDDWLKKAIHDLRNLSHTLNTTLIKEKGIAIALESILEPLHKTGKFKTYLDCSANLNLLDDNRSVILFRMIQEMLNNIIKHAQATEINIGISESDNVFIFTIQDNGIGFNSEKALQSSSGAGLKNLYNRAKTINAVVDLHSEINKGTVITISVTKNISYKKL